ncbi:hypothetical protein HS041_12220 [Planomonospora sp. ID67723]|uniref:hypothetical protein n=1 Tax=Planomonospora sp. ID67723 TaxID=2738134 RepID=UPI0018C38C05|nr:hypothetical protein [Planomonospora sp. ID67723]MBG0828534.1 hypothetical protein [Planomonospora sp. ID67723]
MSVHSCATLVPAADEAPGLGEWICPVCGRVWERHDDYGVIDGEAFRDVRFQPRERCSNCERCHWQPDVDCGKPDHPHCPRCSHCLYRHDDTQPGEENP